MALITKAPRGTQDFIPEKSARMRYIEDTLMRIAGLHGFGEIRTPTFEHTELFVRSVGDTTDVVQKEMYTFEDKKGRSITLKPEIVDPEDVEMLQDLIVAAVNEAIRTVEETANAEMDKITNGLQIPGMV